MSLWINKQREGYRWNKYMLVCYPIINLFFLRGTTEKSKLTGTFKLQSFHFREDYFKGGSHFSTSFFSSSSRLMWLTARISHRLSWWPHIKNVGDREKERLLLCDNSPPLDLTFKPNNNVPGFLKNLPLPFLDKFGLVVPTGTKYFHQAPTTDKIMGHVRKTGSYTTNLHPSTNNGGPTKYQGPQGFRKEIKWGKPWRLN